MAMTSTAASASATPTKAEIQPKTRSFIEACPRGVGAAYSCDPARHKPARRNARVWLLCHRRGGAGHDALGTLLAGAAGDADRADDLAVGDDRHATFARGDAACGQQAEIGAAL